MDIRNCKAYELIGREELPGQKSIGYLLRHKKTRARVAVIENEDENKVFQIGFRTPPADSTGVAHIVEHTVLCGSREFPVKDPFIELEKGSLNTFLNAMTYPDKTVYPVASCNDKDFQNLMHVYLDAVFYPNIYTEEKIFKQEGWHYEMEDVESPVTYNGVVFNEMKGVFSSPEELLIRDIRHSLFPDTPYAVESGGDPADIPTLSYEGFLDFHGRYYHPSNSYLYLYGDMDMEEKLNWIDEHYLNDFSYQPVDSEIKLQKPFEKKIEKCGFYSVTEGEEKENGAYLSYNVVCGDSKDFKLYQSMDVLEYVLVRAVGAPVKQALTDAGIGTEITCYCENVRQTWFTIIAKNAKMEQKDDFLRIIEETLKKLADEGLNRQSVLAAIHSMEFQYREADYGNYPKGLMYGLQMFDSWLYEEDLPFLYLKAEGIFEELRKETETGYFEKLIRQFFLDNPHASFVSMQPKKGLTGRMEQEEKEKLAKFRESLTWEEKEKLVKETAELKKYQEEPTPSEDLACIPLLTRSDIGRKAAPFYNEERSIGGRPVLFHNIYTNGIAYMRFSFDIWNLREYAPYISLLTELIGFVDTDGHDKLSLGNEILLHAGDVSASTASYAAKKSKETRLTMEVTARVLYPETGYVTNLIREILTTSHLGDEKRLREVIREVRTGKQLSLQSAGHTTTAWRAMAYFQERLYLTEQMKGISYYEFLCELDDHFEEHKENLTAVLKWLAGEIFVTDRVLMSVTADEEGYAAFSEAALVLLKDLQKRPERKKTEPLWKMKSISSNEGFKTAGKVQYVARAGSFADKGIAYDGVFKVVQKILNFDYLWNEVRVKGGAYDVMCGFVEEGCGYMASYRDPNLEGTNTVFEKIPEYLEGFDADERDMMKYIIGTISTMDTPLTPRAKGRRSYMAWMTETSWEEKQREREQVLDADSAGIRKAAAMLKAVLSDGYICALGGEKKVEQAAELFEEIRTFR